MARNTTKTSLAMGRKPREPLPRGEEAEKELERLKRNERRRRRAEIKRAVRDGKPIPDAHPADQSHPPMVDIVGIPTAEEMRQQMWTAFGSLGGVAGLVQWGQRYPKEFYSVWARVCIPKSLSEAAVPNSLEDMLSKLGDDDD